MALCVVTLLLFNLLFLASAQDIIVPERGPELQGGWHIIPKNGQKAQDAANAAFGLWARRQPPGLAYRLGSVMKAEEKVVNGFNYKLAVIVESSLDAVYWRQVMLCRFSLYMPMNGAPTDVVDRCAKFAADE